MPGLEDRIFHRSQLIAVEKCRLSRPRFSKLMSSKPLYYKQFDVGYFFYPFAVERRTGFAISVKEGEPANKLIESRWEAFYEELCEELRHRFPELYRSIFFKQRLGRD